MSEHVQPNPPRYRWLKRLLIVAGVALLAAVGLRGWWGQVQDARLEAVIAAIAARGEPIRLEDFQQPLVPETDNAATYYLQAHAAWPKVNGRWIHDIPWTPGVDPDPVTDNAAYLAQCAPAIDLVRQAGTKPQCSWQTLPSPAMLYIFEANYLSPPRNLTQCLGDAAERAQRQGNDALALELLNLTLNLQTGELF